MPLPASRSLRAIALASGALLAVPASAGAGQIMFGSDLSSPADAVEEHGADTVYWNGALASQRLGPPVESGYMGRFVLAGAAPADGQLRYVTIRGGVLPGGGLTRFRFVVLRPQPDGTVKIAQVAERESGLGITSDPMYRSPHKNYNWDLCFRKGDHLGLWKLGHGNLRIFSTVPGSTTSWYESATGIGRGALLTGTASADRELLMQVLMETGRDAFDHCPGGYQDHVFTGLGYVSTTARLRSGTNAVAVRVRCPRHTYGGCFGRLNLLKGSVTLGGRSFSLASGRSSSLPVTLSPPAAARLRRNGSIRAKVVVKAHDDPSDARNRRAPGRRPGRQSGNFIDQILLKVGG